MLDHASVSSRLVGLINSSAADRALLHRHQSSILLQLQTVEQTANVHTGLTGLESTIVAHTPERNCQPGPMIRITTAGALSFYEYHDA